MYLEDNPIDRKHNFIDLWKRGHRPKQRELAKGMGPTPVTAKALIVKNAEVIERQLLFSLPGQHNTEILAGGKFSVTNK